MKALVDFLIALLVLKNLKTVLVSAAIFGAVCGEQCFNGVDCCIQSYSDHPIRIFRRDSANKFAIVRPLPQMFLNARHIEPRSNILWPHSICLAGNESLNFPGGNLARFDIPDAASRIEVKIKHCLLAAQIEIVFFAFGDNQEDGLIVPQIHQPSQDFISPLFAPFSYMLQHEIKVLVPRANTDLKLARTNDLLTRALNDVFIGSDDSKLPGGVLKLVDRSKGSGGGMIGGGAHG